MTRRSARCRAASNSASVSDVRECSRADDTLLNVKQVAQYLQLKESTIYSWAQDGKIPAIKIGRNWRFRRSDLDGWLEQHLKADGQALTDE